MFGQLLLAIWKPIRELIAFRQVNLFFHPALFVDDGYINFVILDFLAQSTNGFKMCRWYWEVLGFYNI